MLAWEGTPLHKAWIIQLELWREIPDDSNVDQAAVSVYLIGATFCILKWSTAI